MRVPEFQGLATHMLRHWLQSQHRAAKRLCLTMAGAATEPVQLESLCSCARWTVKHTLPRLLTCLQSVPCSLHLHRLL